VPVRGNVTLTVAAFEARCQPAAADLCDRLLRYVSSWHEWDLALPTVWPLIVRNYSSRFPWEWATDG
jgi:hypothetical protein